MKRCVVAGVLFVSILPGSVTTDAQSSAGLGTQQPSGVPTTPVDFFARTARISEFLTEFVDTSAVPGVSIALGVGDDLTWFGAFGYADLDNRRPATPHTRFRIGSVSKALTAATLGLLLEEGALDLDAPVQHYVPEFPEKPFPITSSQLAHHLAGIRHYRGDEAYSDRHFESVLEALSVFENDPLVVEPGTGFSYSTYGYTLLSAAMERASGVPFLSLMNQRVIEPLGMTHTQPERHEPGIPDQATNYELGPDREPWIPPEVDFSNKWAGGGYVSTAGDLLKFARAHLGGTFLGPASLDLLWTSGATDDGTETGMGVGWQVAPWPGGGTMVIAGGSAIGGTAVMFVFPAQDAVVVFLTNMGNAPIRGVPMRVARVLLGDEDG